MNGAKFFFVYIFLVVFFSCNQPVSEKGVTYLKPEQFKELLMADVQLVDVRTPNEFGEAHIPNAQNYDYFSNTFSNSIKALDTTKPVYIYCKSGKRSKKSTKHFKKAGFDSIYNLQGGILNWNHYGFPLHNNNSNK